MATYCTFKKLVLFLILSIVVYSCAYDSDDNPSFNRIVLSDTDPNNPFPFNGPQPPIDRIPYPEINNNQYCIDVEEWDIPINRAEPEKTTRNLQAAIDWAVNQGYGIICVPEGHYLIGIEQSDIYYGGIELGSNIALMLDQNAVIEMTPNNRWNYCAIRINNQSNVVVSGGTIIGDRDNHEYTARNDGSRAHDEGHLICIEGESQNVTVENMILGKANGDGVLIVGSGVGQDQMLTDININRNNFSDNRRQGVSIVGGRHILIENNEFHHTNGTAPEFGIDIEGAGRINDSIVIRTNYFHHNKGGDIVNTDGTDIIVENNILLQGQSNTYIDGPLVYWKNASWTIRNNNITMRTQSVNNWNGIIMYSNSSPKTNPDTTFVHNNTLNKCGMYMYNGADLSVRNNIMLEGHLAFSEMDNLILENNSVEHPDECWAYRFRQVSGTADGNNYNGTLIDIPLQQNAPWNGCWID
ncbi:right-handed parallel beta-helix repeat-containing protein [Seonamhaeicola marinus]|uniref:Right-handed parallel beta-helix repeat-containing protein n=1 Tax=Seonamhaeicola marinus TaxID=1912246 RepID=A0A5D0HRA2_9FLAO|nr:right-handed parallel beta-helix repeat-containing protein [Seonamhaeicola marinus]TYA71912.1 right-handed parallel beta-helix repeat-containing protein [Seonamhaeicola marinus]